ncbi:helix-turn-helix transcriptional regulator [Catellatospora citrea]|uniref:LuxR family transcriptional regulator n=1 Tax=Catellatospora citrea TaxID=53366 RepID=A0A8J3KF38_9ACTN|nr:LuxR family transcriptional regulator [Catellatospora citrea]GIF99434.1 LuxR family transcriptional regulator [Catellatospora citrea]
MPMMLFGREPQVRLLQSAADEAAAGRGSATLVEGESGIGKSALLDTVAAYCDRLGMRVLRAAGEQLEQDLPFAVAGACLDVLTTGGEPGRARVAALLRGEGADRQPGAAGHDFVVTEAMLDLVDEWCADGPVAVIVDDVQWADPQSIVVLHRLCRGIGQYPLLVVISAAPEPRGEAMGALVRSMVAKGAQRMTLSPLAQQAAAELVEAAVGAPAGPQLARLVAAVGGHPLYLAELVAGLVRDGALRISGGRAETDLDTPPAASLQAMIMSRLGPLPAPTKAVLHKAAALGGPVDLPLLAAVLDLPVLELADACAAATGAGLLVETEAGLQFRHDLIRQGLAVQTPSPVRDALHLRAAQVLMDRGADVEQIAEHLAQADHAEHGQWLMDVAPQLTVRAPALAVTLLRAAAADAADEATATSLHIALIRALLWAGQTDEAEQILHDQLAAYQSSAVRTQLLELRMDGYFRQGRLQQAAAAGEDAARLAPVHPGRLFGFAAVCRLLLGEFGEGDRLAGEALRSGLASGDAVAQAYGHNTLAVLRFAQNRVQEALDLNADAMRALDHTDGGLIVDPLVVRAMCLFAQDHPAELDQVLDAAMRRNHDTGGFYLTTAQLLRANVLFLRGRWDDALAEIRTSLDSPDPLCQAPALHGLAAMVAMHRGQTRTLDAELATLATSTPLETRFTAPLRWAHSLAAETDSGPGTALDILYPLWEQPPTFSPRCIGYRLCADLARFAHAAGDTARLQVLVDTTAELLTGQPIASLEGTVAFCRGLRHDDPSQLLAAAASFARAEWPLYEGYAREYAAVVLAGDGRLKPARDELASAVALYTGLDAARDIDRARARARQAGIRQGVRGPRGRPKHGWAALSDTEYKVAMAVAEGRSNPDIAAQMFLSPRTVQSHVSSILAKLGLRSRVEIAVGAATAEHREAMAGRRAPDGEPAR